MDFLKDVFGEEALTFEQLAEKLKGNKAIKLGNLAGGEYVSREKLGALETERDGLKEQLTAANTKLEGYDPEWQKKATEAEQAMQSKINQVKFDYALAAQLTQAKVKNPATITGLLDKEALKLDGDQIKGLSEQLEKIKAENDFLFEAEQQTTPPPKFSVPGTPGTPKPSDKAYMDNFYKDNPFYGK